MARVDEYLDLVDDPSRQSLVPGDPADDALLALLAHVAFSDGHIDAAELGFLAKVLPGRAPAELELWANQAGSRPLDLEQVASALPGVADRWKGLRFAVRMAWRDGELHTEELALLQRLVWALELPEGALSRIIDEVRSVAEQPVTRKHLAKALHSTPWASVQLADGGCRDNLKGVAPEHWEGVARLGLEMVEVMGFYVQGVVGGFLEGSVALTWGEIVAYTRMPTLGAAVQLHTDSGRTLTLVDHRMRGLVPFFDRLYGPEERAKTSPPPPVRQVRGRSSNKTKKKRGKK